MRFCSGLVLEPQCGPCKGEPTVSASRYRLRDYRKTFRGGGHAEIAGFEHQGIIEDLFEKEGNPAVDAGQEEEADGTAGE